MEPERVQRSDRVCWRTKRNKTVADKEKCNKTIKTVLVGPLNEKVPE